MLLRAAATAAAVVIFSKVLILKPVYPDHTPFIRISCTYLGFPRTACWPFYTVNLKSDPLNPNKLFCGPRKIVMKRAHRVKEYGCKGRCHSRTHGLCKFQPNLILIQMVFRKASTTHTVLSRQLTFLLNPQTLSS